ncbi:MAG: phosphate ABC transporter ATP-binding protein [Candidatus Lokiarchaeota archaeon]|nr:phosphate ABC transporter ATP-binding protein [Candidatus Lokiarchaeota archaeon]MBD3337673.1 phosphate ABC transporter ATP-binding protein [Candidatus Lokiarchaeota archaeon]
MNKAISEKNNGTNNGTKLGKKNQYDDVIIECEDLNLWYDDNHALQNINMIVRKNQVTAIIGPSGCGKSTLIRTFNRMNDVIDGCKIKGVVKYKGKNIYSPRVNVMKIRKKIGMIFQKPNPFPMSIKENILYGPKIHRVRDNKKLNIILEESLKRAVIWDEVKDRLKDNALGLSGGQQQRLCIARALAIEPEIILMDEPTSALDPIATSKIEELILELKKKYTVVIVTHNMQQAARISDYTAFMYLGELVEFGETEQIFENPQEKLTENYITGRFG